VTAVETPIPAPEHAVGRPLAIALGLLTIFGPISMDLYLPVLPALTAELQSTTSVAQLTVTACLLGSPIGQVATGRLSDRLGRRMPPLIGVVGCTHRTRVTARLGAGIGTPFPGRSDIRGHKWILEPVSS
jgi:DHA1 family bicyclomycin/chloramphenicol resistance-like MFS transporter